MLGLVPIPTLGLVPKYLPAIGVVAAGAAGLGAGAAGLGVAALGAALGADFFAM
jgi:hypothetical protein